MSNIYMKFPEGRGKALTFSYDDGVVHDRRLVEIFNRYGMKCTFNINSANRGEGDTETRPSRLRLEYKEMKELYRGHEIALHTYTHPFPHLITSADMVREVVLDRLTLEREMGTIITGMAYPMGTYNDETVDVLRLSGVSYSRTVEATHTFNYPPKNWLTLHPTTRHADKRLFEHAENFLAHDIRKNKTNWLFYVWGHSYEFEDDGNWDMMEKFCEKLSRHDDVWYATNMEIFKYQQAFDRLEKNLDNTIIHNPSDIDVWVLVDNECVKIGKGETYIHSVQ